MHEESLSDQNVEMKLELPMQSPPVVAKRPVGRRQAFARAFREPIDRAAVKSTPAPFRARVPD
jgi:hypothetical protein